MEVVRDDALRALIRDSNPWWQAAVSGADRTAWATADPTLTKRARHDLGYRADVFSDIANARISDSLHVLRGPRRVGKSVAIKDLVVELCRRDDISPWQIIYFPADNMSSNDLRRAFAIGRDLSRSADVAPRIWLVDEVTAIDNWTSTIKTLRDNTALAHDTVVLTGSSATSAETALRDLGAGRTGESNLNPFRLLLPMSFAEFVRSTDPTIPQLQPVPAWNLQTPTVAQTAAEMEPYTDLLDLAWQRYLECGGFPRAVSEYTKAGAVSDRFARDLVAWLRTDVDPDGQQECVPLLLDSFHRHTTSPLNVRATGEQLGMSRTILSTRINRLVHAFGAVTCPKRNDDGSLVSGAQSKIYLLDPLLAHIASQVRPGLSPRDYTALTEAALAVTLARVIDETSPGRLVDGDTIGYARSDRGREVDLCPVPMRSPAGDRMTTPIESKWVTTGWRSEARVVEAKYNAGIVATKNLTDTNSPAWALPAPLLALLLGN